MHTSKPRPASPRSYEIEHTNGSTLPDTAISQHPDMFYHQSTYDLVRYPPTPTIQGYASEVQYDRSGDLASHQIAHYEPEVIEAHNQPYSYAAPQIQTAQPHVPSQTPQFPMPASRGTHDATGQACPPGGRPRVSTTIWEDEGTLCFQVEAHQITVARREDNNMINGTKLLNVAQMSRGKRDGILKNEADRSVIKVGSMHLKGVWIPFERALELANKYYVTDILYPLFVKDIKKFLYHPANFARTTAVLAAANHRQALQGQSGTTGESLPEERPLLDRAASMPTPLDRSLSMLTPPSSASTTNGDYWTGSSQSAPISDTHARAHSLPGTPATTPPGANYFHGMQKHSQQAYLGSFTDPRPQISSNHYGQQPDMQRSYQHSRNTSLMSYQDEDMSNASCSHNVLHESYINQPQQQQSQGAHDQTRYANQMYNASHDRLPSYPHREIPHQGTSSSHNASRTQSSIPTHSRSHSRSHSKGSLKMFNTPNLTTQMNRRAARTPNASPNRTHARHASQELQSQSNQASLWVQQQQQMSYNTPQQPGRGHSRQMSGQLPHIYEETPSCRMAYQLHGHTRLAEQYSRIDESNSAYGATSVDQYPLETGASPLTGKKKRERGGSNPDGFQAQSEVAQSMTFGDRQESLTPPPIAAAKDDYEESPKRRRTGMNSKSIY